MTAEIDYSKSQMTVGYLVREGTVLLIEKGRNIGMGKLVGVGGRQEPGETIDETATREIEEEIGVKATKMRKAAEMEFVFPHNPKYGGHVVGYVVEEWEGEPQITDEAKSINWYKFDELPNERMWHDNTIWVPLILEGKNVRGRFVIGADDKVIEQTLEEVQNWDHN
jgi:8-oxo-dGTP diphosphatase